MGYMGYKIKLKKVFSYIIEFILPKLPLMLLVLSALVEFLSPSGTPLSTYIHKIKFFLDERLFTVSRLEMLTTISVVLIGFYITVISVFGSSYSQAVVIISKNQYSNLFIKYASYAILSAFIYFLLTIFYDVFQWDFFVFIYTSIFLWLVANFIRFSLIILLMYKENINKASDIVENEEKYKRELFTILKEIKERYTFNEMQNEIYRFNKIKEISSKQRGEAKDIPFKEEED